MPASSCICHSEDSSFQPLQPSEGSKSWIQARKAYSDLKFLVQVAFHPGKPFLFVATQNHVRIYNLAKQALAKKLLAGSGLSCMAVHPSGDHVIIGSEVRLSSATPVSAPALAMKWCWVFTLHVRCLCEGQWHNLAVHAGNPFNIC